MKKVCNIPVGIVSISLPILSPHIDSVFLVSLSLSGFIIYPRKKTIDTTNPRHNKHKREKEIGEENEKRESGSKYTNNKKGKRADF